MVVQCPTCQSKFRIGDDKVTDRGVRVRCTSCKNVFQVKKSGVVPPDPAPAGQTVEMSPLDAAALARPAPRSSAPPPRSSAPPPRPAAPPSAPPANGARKLASDDLFGMAELTGDAAPSPRTTPPRPVPKAPPKPMPNFDDIDIEVPDTPAAAAPRAPSPPPRASAPPLPKAPLPKAPPPPPRTPTPPETKKTEAADDDAVKLGAFKTQLKDPFEGMDMGAEGTGAIELATQPKRDKLMEAAARADAEKVTPAAPEAPVAIAPPVLAKPADPEPTPGRAIVSSALTGLLGAALAIGVVIVSALSDDAATGWFGLGPASDIVATRVVSGLYDTASGKPIFYVRGRVENRSDKIRGPVKVTAELVQDGAAEGHAEAIAGAEPTPEDVYLLKSAADAANLNKTLELSQVERKLQPGASLPFFAVIADPPSDLQNTRLRVRVEPVDAWVPPAPAKGKGK